MFVIFKGVEYKFVVYSECKIMFVELKGVVNIGDLGGELIVKNDVWV